MCTYIYQQRQVRHQTRSRAHLILPRHKNHEVRRRRQCSQRRAEIAACYGIIRTIYIYIYMHMSRVYIYHICVNTYLFGETAVCYGIVRTIYICIYMYICHVQVHIIYL